MSFFNRRKAELDEELRMHLEMDIHDRMQRGEPQDKARAAAMRELGNVGLIRDVTHAFWRWERLESFTRNLKFGLRSLRRSPGFSIAVIVTLAVGIGATIAMFSVVDTVLLKSLPYSQANQLVEIKESGTRGPLGYGSPFLDIDIWRQRNHTLSALAFYDPNERVAFLEGNTGATHVIAPTISANLFETLGAHPALGRGFAALDAGASVKPDDGHTMILSDAVWRANYGGQTEILGKTVKLNGESYTIIGVMPAGFTFPLGGAAPEVWTPIVLGEADKTRVRNVTPPFKSIARLKPGATLQQAEAELKVIQTDVAKGYTDPQSREEVTSVSLNGYESSLVKADLRKALLALFGASGLLWLIACVNVTGLLLARATARQREIAVRGALGASRWQIVQQLLLEGMMLSGAASVVGLALAAAMLRIFARALTKQFDLHQSLAPNLAVVAAVVGLTVVTALGISMWPAMSAARVAIEPALRQGGSQHGAGRSQHRARMLLVVTEIALSLSLLAGCGLLLRTIYALKHVPLGFRTEHILVANMTVPSYRFTGKDMGPSLYQPLLERVQHLPGVESASLMTEVPLGKTFQMIFTFGVSAEEAKSSPLKNLESQFRAVSPQMQQVFGFRMFKGRFFNEQDTATSQPVVVVNRAFARIYLGQDTDLSKILGAELIGFGKDRQARVVGVLDDARQVSVAEQSKPEIEVCLPQLTPDSGIYHATEGIAMDLAVRTERSPAAIIPELRQAMQSAAPELSMTEFSTMDQVVEDSFGSQKLAAELLEIFGGSALFLSIAGIYGLLAYLVAQRTREMGLRIALGAQRSNVTGLILRQTGWMLIAGLSVGLVLAWLGSLALRSFLYEVKPHDPWTLAAVTLLLLVSGLAAAWVPARRAAMVDPMQALRAE